MEKRVVLAMILSVVILMAWSAMQAQFAPPAPPKPVETAGPGAPAGPADGNGAQPAPGRDPVENGGAPPVAPPAPPPAENEEQGPAAVEKLDWGPLKLRATSRGGCLESAAVWACVYHAEGSLLDSDLPPDPGIVSARFESVPGFLALRVLGRGPDLSERHWHMERRGGVLEFRTQVGALGIEIIKTLTPGTHAPLSPDEVQAGKPEPPPYHLDMVLEVRPLADARSAEYTFEIVGPWLPLTELPLPEDGVVVSTGDVKQYSASEIEGELEDDPAYELSAKGLEWIGARSQFHLGIVDPSPLGPDGAALQPALAGTSVSFLSAKKKLPDEEEPRLSAAPTLRFPVSVPSPGTSFRHEFRVYVGPASRPVLTETEAYKPYVPAFPNRKIIGIGFGPIQNGLGWVLKLLAEGAGLGYGLAVAALTLIVRGLLFPLSRKSQMSMRIHAKKMQKLKPKMDAIKAKYKDSRKQQEMTMKLMRQEKVGLVPGGCLVAFVQMPIWISLYGILQTTFEMRHASFLWAADLTAPDHLLHLPFMKNVPFLPEWLNLFPILMMITWGISARMTPLPADPQQQQQAKMMRWMPMLFGVFLYNFASGLTIYMTMSALWSIGEIQLIRRVWLSKLDVD